MYQMIPIQHITSGILLASIMTPFFIHSLTVHHSADHHSYIAGEIITADPHNNHEKEPPHIDPEVEYPELTGMSFHGYLTKRAISHAVSQCNHGRGIIWDGPILPV